jgi:hypothetical protein
VLDFIPTQSVQRLGCQPRLPHRERRFIAPLAQRPGPIAIVLVMVDYAQATECFREYSLLRRALGGGDGNMVCIERFADPARSLVGPGLRREVRWREASPPGPAARRVGNRVIPGLHFYQATAYREKCSTSPLTRWSRRLSRESR